jgi:hypothetical protein
LWIWLSHPVGHPILFRGGQRDHLHNASIPQSRLPQSAPGLRLQSGVGFVTVAFT